MQFDSACSTLVSQARGQSIGDLPRRSAARFPDKFAIVHGDRFTCERRRRGGKSR